MFAKLSFSIIVLLFFLSLCPTVWCTTKNYFVLYKIIKNTEIEKALQITLKKSVHENTKQNFQIEKKGQIRNDAGSTHDQTCIHTCVGASQWDPFLVQLRYTDFEGRNIFGRIILLFFLIFKKSWKHLDFFGRRSLLWIVIF